MTTQRLTLSTLHNVDADRLTDELAAAGYDSTPRPIAELRRDVAQMLYEMVGPFDLCDDNNDIVREATIRETVDSVATPEGWIDVDGERYYVAE